MATVNAFHDTKVCFRDYIQYEEPLSFEDWAKLPTQKKIAALYVQFYNQITLAWDKANSLKFANEEDGVSTVCQYLEKNVSRIESDPKRFDAKYIYRVAYNCLYCICGHDRKCDKDRIEFETSGIVMYDGKELDILDMTPDKRGSAEDQIVLSQFEHEFWSIIEDTGLSAEKVLRYLTTKDQNDLKKLTKRNKRYNDDPLRDVEVSLEEMENIIKILRAKFLSLPASSECGRYISKFQNLYN